MTEEPGNGQPSATEEEREAGSEQPQPPQPSPRRLPLMDDEYPLLIDRDEEG